MILSLILTLFSRRDRFVWSPDLDLSDSGILSALIPHTQY